MTQRTEQMCFFLRTYGRRAGDKRMVSYALQMVQPFFFLSNFLHYIFCS